MIPAVRFLLVIRVAMMSAAITVIFPMQDVLGHNGKHRMNRPARKKGNRKWRLLPQQLTLALNDKLLKMTQIYGSCKADSLAQESTAETL